MSDDEVSMVNASADNLGCLVSGTRALKLSPKPMKKASAARTSPLPPCRVCNAVASGFHYGANTCEPCKAFFRRSIGNEDSIKPCQAKGKCAENPDGKKMSCSDCRHKKCLLVGMTKEGSKRGRYTYEKKSLNTKELQRMKADEALMRNFELEHCDETVANLVQLFRQSFFSMRDFWDDKAKIDHQVTELVTLEQLKKGELLTRVLYSPGHSPSLEVKKWYDNLREYLFNASYNPGESSLPSLSAEQMVFREWGDQEERTFHGLARFAKGLPGFSDLQLEDKVVLLKEGKTDCLNVIKHKTLYADIEAKVHYYEETGDLLLVPLVYMRKAFGDEFTSTVLLAMNKLWKLNLTTEDMAVLLAFVIFSPEREGLQRPELVSQLQDKMLTVLHYTLRKNHPEQPNILADTLLLLPLFTEHTIKTNKDLEMGSNILRKVAISETHHPLLLEMMGT